MKKKRRSYVVRFLDKSGKIRQAKTSDPFLTSRYLKSTGDEPVGMGRRYKNMARRRRKSTRARSFFARKTRRYSRSSGSMNPTKVILPALAYGAVRNVAASYATPITSKMGFLGNYADEALFGTAGYFMAKKGRGMIKQVGIAMLTVEAASVGNQLAGQFTGGTSTTSSNGFLYG